LWLELGAAISLDEGPIRPNLKFVVQKNLDIIVECFAATANAASK